MIVQFNQIDRRNNQNIWGEWEDWFIDEVKVERESSERKREKPSEEEKRREEGGIIFFFLKRILLRFYQYSLSKNKLGFF